MRGVCVWGNHTSILNESTIGRSVTFQRVCIQEYEGVCECMCVCSLSLYFLKEHCNCQHQKTTANARIRKHTHLRVSSFFCPPFASEEARSPPE